MAEIYKALAAVNKSIKAIGKDRTNQQQGFKFRGIDDVMNELHSLFAANEIIILQTVNEVNVTERTNQRGTALFYVRINVTYHFTHSDGSMADVTVTGEAMDSGDKATNKAMSAAYKYAAFQAFSIPTESDNDADAHSHEVIKRTGNLTDSAVAYFLATISDAETMCALREAFAGAYKAAESASDDKAKATFEKAKNDRKQYFVDKEKKA